MQSMDTNLLPFPYDNLKEKQGANCGKVFLPTL
jgi:hypothetical protein